MPNFVTKYVIFCELWEKMSVPDIKKSGFITWMGEGAGGGGGGVGACYFVPMILLQIP